MDTIEKYEKVGPKINLLLEEFNIIEKLGILEAVKDTIIRTTREKNKY